MANHENTSPPPAPCPCAQEKKEDFLEYKGFGDRPIGYRCSDSRCGKEWVIDLQREYSSGDANDRSSNEQNEVKLYKSGNCKAFGRSSFRNLKVACEAKRRPLKPGDHIAWRRRFGHWHHAIVRNVFTDSTKNIYEVKVVHFSPVHGLTVKVKNATVVPSLKERQTSSEGVCSRFCCDVKQMCGCSSGDKTQSGEVQLVERGRVYRVEYTTDNADPAELVVARAKALAEKYISSREGNNRYMLFKNNCEHFATHCKTGVHASYQVLHLMTIWQSVLIALVVKPVALNFIILFLAEVLEAFSKYSEQTKNWIGIGIIIGLELLYVLCRLYGLFKEYKRSSRNGRDAGAAAFEMLVEQSIMTLMVIGLSLLPEQPPKLVLASVGGLIIGVPLTKYLGIQIGRVVTECCCCCDEEQAVNECFQNYLA